MLAGGGIDPEGEVIVDEGEIVEDVDPASLSTILGWRLECLVLWSSWAD